MTEGLPEFYVKDIPPVGPPELKIDRPEIYFGEETRQLCGGWRRH